jgi:hypothetical protein
MMQHSLFKSYFYRGVKCDTQTLLFYCKINRLKSTVIKSMLNNYIILSHFYMRLTLVGKTSVLIQVKTVNISIFHIDIYKC